MDVLSTVLKTVKLEGAMFYNAEFSAPWSFRSPPSCLVAPYQVAGARHVIIYHLLAWAGLRECRGRSASFAVRRGHRRLSRRRSAPHETLRQDFLKDLGMVPRLDIATVSRRASSRLTVRKRNRVRKAVRSVVRGNAAALRGAFTAGPDRMARRGPRP